jgi:radical SAM protein with 4Fe4S-binding SPASM domain
LVLHKKNIGKIEAVIDIIKPYKPYTLIIMPLVLDGRAKQLMGDYQITSLMWKKILLEKPLLQKKHPELEITIDGPVGSILEKNLDLNVPRPCMCGLQYIGISPEGEILVCPISLLSVGNVRSNKDIQKIWRESPVLKKIRDHNALKGKCRHCRFKIVCRGGCRGLAESIYGDILKPDPLCWL